MAKNDNHRKNRLEDIKTMFDGIKCLGLSLAIGLSPPWLQEPMIAAGFSYETRGLVDFIVLVMSGALAIAALYWTFGSLKTEPGSKLFHAISVLALILIALAVVAAAIYSAYKHSPFALF